MSLAIRFATATDAPTIHRFVVALATYEREPDAVAVTPEILASQLRAARPPFECLLAEVDGAPVGFALFFQTYSTWRGRIGVHLEDLFVVPEHRRHGIASALLRRLAGLTHERGGARLEWAVLDWNAPAIAFYRRLGGEPLTEWTTWRVAGEGLGALADPDARTPVLR